MLKLLHLLDLHLERGVLRGKDRIEGVEGGYISNLVVSVLKILNFERERVLRATNE